MGPEFIKNIISELNSELIGAVISRVHQPAPRDLVLKLYSRGAQRYLLISVRPELPRIHLTEEDFINPPAPLAFCAFLRSRITDARVEAFVQAEGQRIVNIILKKREEEKERSYTLVAELTGKSGNLILIDGNGVILECLKRFPIETSKRAVVPGIRLEVLPAAPVERPEALPERAEGSSWNKTAEALFAPRAQGNVFALERNRIKRAINDAGKRLKKKLENLKSDQTRALEELGFQRFGELLAANVKKIQRGMKEIEAPDYAKYPPEQVRIALDEKIGPHQNVEKYFKRSKKAKVALKLLEERMPEVERELEYIDSLLFEWEEAQTPEGLSQLIDDLYEAKYLKRPVEPKKRPEEERAEPFRRYISKDGFEVLCGRSSSGNDIIVRNYAKEGDIWLHAAGVSGSHVLIKMAGADPDAAQRSIIEAASLAAWHSRNRGSAKAEVIYTDAKNVKKPRGARPGMVTVRSFKTIMVEPKDMDGNR